MLIYLLYYNSAFLNWLTISIFLHFLRLRGQVQLVDEKSLKCQVRLIDFGTVIIKTFDELFLLPENFQFAERQMGTITITDVKNRVPISLITKYLESVIGDTVFVTITHKVSVCFRRSYDLL